jgi:carboxymethylenebutenolidase
MKGESPMDLKIVNLFHKYVRGLLNRREFLKRLSIMASGVVAAQALLPLLEGNHARAEIIPKNDPRLQTDNVKYPGATGDVRAYFEPKGNENFLE